MHSGPSERWAPRSKWISLHGPHGPVSAMRQKFLSSPASTSPQRAIRSGGRPISSRQIAQATSSSRVRRRRQAVRRDAEVLGEEVPGPVDGLALEVVAEAPVAEHLEERVVAGGPTHLLEVVVLAGDPQQRWKSTARVYERVSAPVRTSLNWTIPEFVNSSVWSPAGTRLALGTYGVAALLEELDEPPPDLGGAEGHDPRVVAWSVWRSHRGNGTERAGRRHGRRRPAGRAIGAVRRVSGPAAPAATRSIQRDRSSGARRRARRGAPRW